MLKHTNAPLISAVFITFSGDCKQALTFYQTCFGGELDFEAFGKELPGYAETPIISGSLISDRITIHGSDLVHNEGRKLGNYISVFLHCESIDARKDLIEKLKSNIKDPFVENYEDDRLVEITDTFDVRWILGI